MPKTDTFLQDLSRLAPGLVEHRIAPRPAVAGDGWVEWSRHDRWVLDYVDGVGMRTEVASPDAPAGPFPRDGGVWHCYAPGTTYREQYQRPRALREWMWFFFIPGRGIPPLTARTFSAIADPEGRLAGYCRTMFAHQQRGGAGSHRALAALLRAAIAEIIAAADHGGDGSAANPWMLRSSSAADEEGLLQRLDRAVSRNLAAPPTLAELAQDLRMSVSSQAHRFKAES
nr:helix-turn-helix transcriptional regulator [Planctomycetota bacterium]